MVGAASGNGTFWFETVLVLLAADAKLISGLRAGRGVPVLIVFCCLRAYICIVRLYVEYMCVRCKSMVSISNK